MVGIWQWVWDRFAARYSWAAFLHSFVLVVPVYLVYSTLIVALEGTDRYLAATTVTIAAVLIMNYLTTLPGLGPGRVVEAWARGREVDRRRALIATYSWSRKGGVRGLCVHAVSAALLFVLISAIAGADGPHMVQYAILGFGAGASVILIAVHSYPESAMRPVRVAMVGNTDIGDALPRSRPSFAAWSNVTVLAAAFAFSLSAAMTAGAIGRVRDNPALAGLVAGALLVFIAVPITVAGSFAPSLRPIQDLAEGTTRVAAGDFSQRLPVIQDDDLGALAASFNRMQAGLAERQRLQSAFGTYVDPVLAARLLEQGDDVFTGERREVTVMFIDIRNFTAWAESNTAEDTVSRLNALFEIVVPAVVQAGGHVNKYLGDGALAAFGAPHDLADHADAAVRAAVLIQRLVGERFGGDLRVGVGINTGVVIAGTIGGGGKLEFTLIGDAVNVAARVEQLTKTTGDAILLTVNCVDALAIRPPGLTNRGSHVLKGKSTPVPIFGLDSASSR